MQDVIKIFDSLPRPESRENTLSFSAVQLEGTSHRIGKDSAGWPVLLVGSSSVQKGAPIRLEHLEVQHGAHCRVTNGKHVEEGTYTVIRCIEADAELSHYFLHTVLLLIKLLGPNPTTSEISRTITYLVELFRALTQPPTKSINGLWGELFVIRNSRDPKSLMSAWHAVSEEKYDFSSGSQRLEVKSTSQRQRTHHFSLEQLSPPSGCTVVIASVFVERNGGGTSLEELVAEIFMSITDAPDLQERLYRVVGTTLGNSLRQGYSSRFDRELAASSLQFFDGAVIPKIDQNLLPSGISDVHFKADISNCPPLSRTSLADQGGIFASI